MSTDSAECAYDYGWNAAADSYQDVVNAYIAIGKLAPGSTQTPQVERVVARRRNRQLLGDQHGQQRRRAPRRGRRAHDTRRCECRLLCQQRRLEDDYRRHGSIRRLSIVACRCRLTSRRPGLLRNCRLHRRPGQVQPVRLRRLRRRRPLLLKAPSSARSEPSVPA